MKPLRFAVVGAGEFAFFSVSEFSKLSGALFVGVYDEMPQKAEKFRMIRDDIRIYSSLEEVCLDSHVDLVYIATPPHLHYPQSKQALLAGKHVICEKPAAIKLDDAVELKHLAAEKGLLFVVNLMQRYNALFDAVAEIIHSKVLGEFLHGFFENYASDEYLKEDHWFWDERRSGGIFIEHGVHFFDMFAGWFGEGRVVAAQKLARAGHPGVWDRVQATVLYAKGLVNFYHGFDQPKVMDRQEMRLQFERGDVTLFEWVPTRLKISAIVTDAELHLLRQIFPSASVTLQPGAGEVKPAHARFKEIPYQHRVWIEASETLRKEALYQQLVRSMFRDQIRWIADRTLERKITDENAVSSLGLATEAERIAVRIE